MDPSTAATPDASPDAPLPATIIVNAVSLKLPPFSTIDAPSWFRRTEIQFRLRKISASQTKADYVLEAIPEDVFPLISQWLDQHDGVIQYDVLKQYLLQEFTPSAASRAAKILQLSQQPLGDIKPSTAYLEMMSIARLPNTANGTSRDVDMLRQLWLMRLPVPVRSALGNAEEMTTDEVSRKADHLADAHAAAARSQDVCATDDATDEIFAAAASPANRRQQHQQRQRRRTTPALHLCYYHTRFGTFAKKCQPGLVAGLYCVAAVTGAFHQRR
ncbi:uncharacterized protein LOC143026728 [Oratosquilla oratoria]|uniref:uncharacterized protein LOC143026728 n=1 Tax=Oratosquilla oratoria TaxID=337810 RepID=UPI003F75A456